MPSRNFKRGNTRSPYAPRPRSGGQTAFNRGGGKRRFTGQRIDINKFIHKAVPIPPIEVDVVQSLFTDFEISDTLKRIIASRGYKHPTPIQDKTIPLILAGHDVIGLANTGTGKTGAFLIPMLHKILKDPHQKMIVVVPTRELAIQIQEEFMKFSRGLRINAVVAVGGANIRPQISQLQSRHNVVVGTPGRLKDLIQRKCLRLGDFKNVVLDEADQMLDMGFINDIEFLLSLVAPVRQTLCFSATLSPRIETLVNKFLKEPVRISIRTQETPMQVDQDVVRVKSTEDKVAVLQKLIAQEHFQKVLIFTRTKRGTEKLSKTLRLMGFKSESIHGNKSQSQRQRALKQFKENQVEILVATDVAARGLDIPNVSHVINFDIPATYEEYIHRIGRTGRIGKTGSALTFVE